MPELRFNTITRDWVIIATERARRPDQFAAPGAGRVSLPSHLPECPFCPGSEMTTGTEVFRISDGAGWKVRIVTNKYPALQVDGERVRRHTGLRSAMTGVGYHEVIIEHPRHDMSLARMQDADVRLLLTAYRDRYRQIMEDRRMELIVVFKNHGERAGSSVVHTHSQLAATPVVPFQVRGRMEEAMRFFDDTGNCLFCATLEEELAEQTRVVLASPAFAVFVPYAALSPFHLWVFPRRHASSFDAITDSELTDLASVVRAVIGKLSMGLNDPPFNITLRSAPLRYRTAEFFHWYLSIIPRVTRTAGFELGSGMFINSALPEESARFLRGVEPPQPLADSSR